MDNSGYNNVMGLLDSSGCKRFHFPEGKAGIGDLLIHKNAVLERRESLRDFLGEFGNNLTACSDEYDESDLDKIGTTRARLKLKPGGDPVIEYSHEIDVVKGGIFGA